MELDPALTERAVATPEQLAAAYVPGASPSTGPLVVSAYDPAWPGQFAAQAERIRLAVPDAVTVEHVGSTSVPGLAAKPIIDVDLIVADSSDEDSYVPALVAAGFELVVREPDWHEHRMLRGVDPKVNLHVFSPGCPEHTRHLMFRDWLRTHDDDRDLYARTKLDLAERDWEVIWDYTSAKDAVLDEIYARMFAAAAADSPG